MSVKDQTLVRELGISVSQVAGAVNKSRQAVNRGLSGKKDYFSAGDLARALETWRQSDSSLYAIAKAKICQIYPEISAAIMAAVERGTQTPFSPKAPGEYWFLTGDFYAFKNSLPNCAKQLEALCALETAQVKIFVNKGDQNAAHRLEVKHQDNNTQTILCDYDLRLVPSTLLHMDDDNQIELYGVADTGFTALSRQEAARLRMVIQDNLIPREKAH